MDVSAWCEALKPVVREAGAAIMAVAAKSPEALLKSDGSPVTEADAAAEALILAALSRLSPQVPVVSEENASSHALVALDRFVLVDPLDGTKEFLKRDGRGSFTVNIALIERGVPVAGVVFAPALDRLFVGVAGEAYEESGGVRRALRVRAVPATGAVAVASLSHRDAQTDAWLQQHGIEQTVSIGSSLKFGLVAAGEADVYPRFSPTMEWDTAAGDAVLRAAGGVVTHPNGEPFSYGKAGYRNTPFVAWGGQARGA